jgi:peptidase E
MATRRIPQIVLNGSQKEVAFDPVATVQFAESDDAATRARQLSELQATLVEVTRATRANRHCQSVFFEDLTVVYGTTYQLRHGLGRAKVYISLVRWKANTPGSAITIELVSDETQTTDTVSVRVYADVVVTLEVF